MRIGITGAAGMIGWHLRCHLRQRDDVEVVPAGRAEFEDPGALQAFVSRCDAIAHLAGRNRGPGDEVHAANVRLAGQLAEACAAAGVAPVLAFANSTHVERDTPYGRSKREAAATLREWADGAGAAFADLVLPHVFGEHGRPFHNSVVATFCHQLAHGEEPVIEHDGELELLHAGDAAAAIEAALRGSRDGRERVEGRPCKVSELLQRLRALLEPYLAQRIPPLGDPLDLRLFNVLRSYLFPGHYPVALEQHSDPRGSLFEAVRTDHGGQAFLSTTKPGITRGNHFHYRKVERFLVVAGEAEIRIRRLFDDEVASFRVSGERPAYVDMPALHTHNITNVGDGELLTLFWAHEIFDPAAPDTVGEDVG